MIGVEGVDFRAMGMRIRVRRKELGLTQGELAKKLDISMVYVSAIERGEKVPSLQTFIQLSVAMGLDVDYLLTGRKQFCDGKDCPLYRELSDALRVYEKPESREH